jgi:multidrug resistance protein, MATE family
MTSLDYEPARERNPSPLRELLMLAGPTVAQMASYTLMQFIDTWLLSHYGTNKTTALEPTAASNSGMFSFALISVGFGTLTVVNTLVSQSYGRGDRRGCGQYLWQGIWFSAFYALLLLPLLPLAEDLFRAFGHEPALAAGEAAYMRIMIGGAGLKLVQVAFGQFLLAINRPMAALVGTLCGVTVNALAAWVLIYGKLGLPPMGIRGSALGQQVGVFVEMTTLILLSLRPQVRLTYYLHDWTLRLRQFWQLLVVGIPAGAQLVADVLAWSLFSVWVMAPFGTDTMAANTFTFRFYSVSFMPAYGISTAVTALVGRYIGRGRPDVSVQRARLGFLVSAAYMLTCGAGFFVGRRILLGLFTQNPEILRIGSIMLIYAAVYQFFDAMYIVYVGALRGAGDTLVPAVATAVLCWGITVAGGRAVGRYLPQWGPAGPWAAATAYGIILGVFMYARFARGRWRTIRLAGGDDSNVIPRSATVPNP